VVVYDPKDFHTLLYRLLPELAMPDSWRHVRIAVRALHMMLYDRRTVRPLVVVPPLVGG
jgi:hypothetical protein